MGVNGNFVGRKSAESSWVESSSDATGERGFDKPRKLVDCLTHDLHFPFSIRRTNEPPRTETNNRIMSVNKTVVSQRNENFYDAKSQHAGSLNINANTKTSRSLEQSLPSTPTFTLFSQYRIERRTSRGTVKHLKFVRWKRLFIKLRMRELGISHSSQKILTSLNRAKFIYDEKWFN